FLQDDKTGTSSRNNESAPMLRIATSAEPRSFLSPAPRFRGVPLNLNLCDPIAICECPGTRSRPPSYCRADFIEPAAALSTLPKSLAGYHVLWEPQFFFPALAAKMLPSSNLPMLSSARLRVSAVR